MNQLTPSNLFDLSNYSHAELFTSCQYAWEALTKLVDFFKNFPKYEIRTEIPTGAHIVNPESIFIGEGTIVEPGAYIRGPCVIGANCTIRHGAYIRGSFVCGDNCTIGHDSEIKEAIFLDDVHASHFAYVGDSILGNHVNLGAGTKCANLRFDRKPIEVRGQGLAIETGRKKFGAILGDHTQTGCNSVTLPGTCTGKKVLINACVSAGGFIPENHLAIYPEKIVIREY